MKLTKQMVRCWCEAADFERLGKVAAEQGHAVDEYLQVIIKLAVEDADRVAVVVQVDRADYLAVQRLTGALVGEAAAADLADQVRMHIEDIVTAGVERAVERGRL